jgi:ribosomal protein S18 acetylase RimI-like enzyme
MDDVELSYDPLTGDTLSRLVGDNLIYVSIGRTGVSDWQPVGYCVKTGRGEILGGLVGQVWGGWLHVRMLWVTEQRRGQRLGTRLMDAAEAFAAEHGATDATLETASFQAPGFYQKRGYTVFAQLDDYPPGHTKYYLRKRLRPVRA